MKIKLLESNYLKALDIDLKLNNNSKANVSSLVKEISRNIERYSSELDLETQNATGEQQKLFIPDDAKIERFDLKDWKSKKEISNRIRLDKSETFYFLMNENDKLFDMVVDGIPTDNTKNSIPLSLQLVDYVLIVKREELLKTKAKKEERVVSEKSSLELQKVKRNQKVYKEFEKTYRKLSEARNDYYKELAEFTKNPESTQQVTSSRPKNLKPILARNLKKGDLIFTSQNPSRDSDMFRILNDVSTATMPNQDDPNTRNINVEVLDQESFRIKNSGATNINTETTYYLYEESKPVPKEDEKNEFEIEEFIPEIDLKTLIKKDTTFPSNLFPEYNSKKLRVIVDEVKKYWSELRDLIDQLKIKNVNIDRILERFQESIESGTRKSSAMYYRDKSGYEVDLGKYFDKLASLPPEIPKIVTEKYTEIFEYISGISKDLVQRIKDLADDEDYDQLSRVSSVLKYGGPKAFNSRFGKKVSNVEEWKRDSRSYIRPVNFIQQMEDFKIDFDEKLNDL